jgi:RNA ligase (TIGR02306 family)
MKLASIQPIVAVEKHPNADLLDVATVLGYKAIVKRDQWKVGDLCIFIEPDSVLPDVPWTAFYKAKSGRVKAIRLRNVWSFGIIESPAVVGYTGPLEAGLDVTEALGISKYEPPQPQDLNAAGPYRLGIPKTDEERWQSVESIPYGVLCDVTLKIDGQSWSVFVQMVMDDPVPIVESEGIGGRSFIYKLDSENNYTRNERQYGVLDKLRRFCRANGGASLCIRGEQYGQGIQKGAHNPHASLPVGLAFFSTWLIDERRYARKGERFYLFDIAAELGLPTVPVIERDVVLTPELIHKYSEGIDKIDGKPFEGVVIQHAQGSFKVINLAYDSRK